MLKNKLLVAAALFYILFTLVFMIAMLNANSQEHSVLERELAAQNKKLDDAQSRIDGLDKQYADLQSKVAQEQADREKLTKTAYLTFDDGPSSLTPQILDVLKAKGVTATFFVVGKDDQADRAVLKRMVTEGDTVGIHSYTHVYSYIYKSEANFLSDFEECRDYITASTGVEPDIMRFPGGLNNTVCLKYGGHIMATLKADVERMGVKPFDWNVVAGDANTTPPTTQTIVNNVVNGYKGRKNAVILCHDLATYIPTLQALPEIIDKLRVMGFVFKTLSPSSPDVEFKPV